MTRIARCAKCGEEFDSLWRVDRMTKQFIGQGMFNDDQVDSMAAEDCEKCSAVEARGGAE